MTSNNPRQIAGLSEFALHVGEDDAVVGVTHTYCNYDHRLFYRHCLCAVHEREEGALWVLAHSL